MPERSPRIRINRRELSIILFLASFLPAILDDLYNLWWYVQFFGAVALRYASDHVNVPHYEYHTLTPPIGLVLAVLLFEIVIALGPYRRGERWAWWTLVLANGLYAAVKLWGSAALYPHWATALALAFAWLVAVGLSYRDFHPRIEDERLAPLRRTDQDRV